MAHNFDFGSGQPLPSPKKEEVFSGKPVFNGGGAPHHNSPFRSFSRDADRSLLDYLRARRISPSFLNEIDYFLAAHPEIGVHQPSFVSHINHTHPLDAYRFFVKGYTKPARYVEGALPDIHNIPLPALIPQISRVVGDDELVDFFQGYEYRFDILEKIDLEVAGLVDSLYHGQRVTFAERKLVVFALYGNVVDTYKYYEYNYQSEWLAHRYLPEHVVLSELPKQPGYSLPVARQITNGDEDDVEHMRSHAATRARMAHANDVGVDVIDVLLEDFTATLCRQGLRRPEIERLRAEALRNIDHQRAIGGPRDIVDMVMDRAGRTTPAEPSSKKVTGRLHRIASLKHSLKRLLAQEPTIYDEMDFVRNNIVKTRMRVERELVHEITYLAESAGTMATREARDWRSLFGVKPQAEREGAGQHIDLFRWLARYL